MTGIRVALYCLLPVLALAVGCGGQEPLLVIAGPDDVTSLELRAESGETLWRVESDEPREIPWVVLGEVPPGFRQVFPVAGERPRDLEPWEPLEIRVVSGTHDFFHYGIARGHDVFEMSNWRMERRVQSEADDTDREEATADEDRR